VAQAAHAAVRTLNPHLNAVQNASAQVCGWGVYYY